MLAPSGWGPPALLALLALATVDATGREVLFRNGAGGELRRVITAPGDSLIELARDYGVGYNEITAANPGVDPFVPDPGTPVTIPTRWLLPEVEQREGIVINLPERRLYFFSPEGGRRVDTYPVGIGEEGRETPLGIFRVLEKVVAPAWHVPASIRRQQPDLPAVVLPGPDNPLGTHALRLSAGSVLIHGTNRPFGIGRRVSHGCIRLYPEDIKALFRRVPVGTVVSIVAQPIKVALIGAKVVVEVHGEADDDLEEAALDLVAVKALAERTDRRKLRRAARQKLGYPVDVTREEAVTEDPVESRRRAPLRRRSGTRRPYQEDGPES